MEIECIESSEYPKNILDLYFKYKKQKKSIEKKKEKLSNNIEVLKQLKIQIQNLIDVKKRRS